MDSKTLSPSQLGWTILLSRLFMLLTFSHQNKGSSGSVALLAVPIGAVLTLVLVHLISLTLRWLNYDGTTDALNKCPKLISKVFFAVAWVYIVVSIALTGAEFNGFLETTVFAQQSIFLYTVLFLICCGYSAVGGRGSIGGLALLSGAFLVVSLATITLAVLPDINLFEIVSPFSEGNNTLLKTSLQWTLSFGELILLVLLAGQDRKTMVKSAYFGVIGSALVYMIFTFLTLTVLGDYSKGTNYPIYQLTRYAGFGFMSRMDLIHIVLWVLTAVLRAAALLYGVSLIFKKEHQKKMFAATFVICSLLSLYFSYNFPMLYYIKQLVSPSIWVTLLIIPCIIIAGKNKVKLSSDELKK